MAERACSSQPRLVMAPTFSSEYVIRRVSVPFGDVYVPMLATGWMSPDAR